MNPLRIVAITATLFFTAPAFAADPPKQDPLIKQLGGDGTPAAKTAEEFEAAYEQVLPSLLAKPEGDDTPLQKIAFRASRPGAEVERAALGKVLASHLSADASVPVKVLLLRHIQRIGREETIPAVVALLSDKEAQVRECARRALANNPTSAAADALRAALDKADDAKWKGALLSALAHRRDPADALVFAKAAASTDDEVKLPALLALARSGDVSAAPILAAARETGSDAAKAAAHDAYLLLAARLIALDQRPTAANIYREYLFSFAPQRFRYAAIIGLGSAGTEEDIYKILNLLADTDVQARGAALEVLSQRRDPAVANEIVARLAKSDAASKPWLLRAFIAQGDKRAKEALLDAAGDADESVRVQAINGLAQLGDASAVPALLKSAAAKGEEQTAARNTLEVLPGNAVDEALLERLAAGPVPQRTEVIRALGARRTPGSVAPLFAAATDPDSSVRSEAWKSLALVADYESLPRALGLLVQAKEDADRDQAAKTVVALARKNDNVDARIAPILSELENAEGAARAALLNALGQLGGEKALAAIRDAIKNPDEKIHEAGVRALAAWPDTAPLNDLLTLAKEEKSNTLQVLSLRGYVRLVGLPNKRPAAESIKLYQDALAAAKRNDEKKMVLGGLGEIKDAKALQVVAPFLSDEALAGEASAAAVKIARDSWEANKDLAKSTMTKVMEVSKSDSQKKAAKEVLDKLAPSPKKPA
jgi:HEAT repeat protein